MPILVKKSLEDFGAKGLTEGDMTPNLNSANDSKNEKKNRTSTTQMTPFKLLNTLRSKVFIENSVES